MCGIIGNFLWREIKKSGSGVTRMDILYLKLAKEFVGAELEIYSEEGVKLLTQKIGKRKVLVDFYI